MLKKFHVRAGLTLGGIFSLALMAPANADPPAKAHRAGTQLASVKMTQNAEKGFEKALLGVRILQSYKVALAKLGQPTRIFRADEYIDFVYDFDAKGKPTGGVTDIVSGGDMKDAQSAGSPSPTPNPGDPSGDPSAPSGGPNAGGFGGGLNGATQEKPPETFGQSGGFIWTYIFKAEKKAYILVFNRDGRALLIIELGQGIGSPTKRNINLGSPLSAVYAKYGWPDSVQENKEGMQLFYDIKHHCQFDVVNNKVNGIAVMLSEGMKVRRLKDHNGSGGNGGNGSNGGGNGGGDGGGGARQMDAPPPPPP